MNALRPPWYFWVSVLIAVPLTWGIFGAIVWAAIRFPIIIIAAAIAGLGIAGFAIKKGKPS